MFEDLRHDGGYDLRCCFDTLAVWWGCEGSVSIRCDRGGRPGEGRLFLCSVPQDDSLVKCGKTNVRVGLRFNFITLLSVDVENNTAQHLLSVENIVAQHLLSVFVVQHLVSVENNVVQHLLSVFAAQHLVSVENNIVGGVRRMRCRCEVVAYHLTTDHVLVKSPNSNYEQ